MTKEEAIEYINGRCAFNKYNGIKVTDFGEDFCIVEAELTEEATNPLGFAHGGLVFSLCDVAAGVAVNGVKRSSVTLSGNIYYLRPSKGKKLRAEGKIIKNGRTVVLVETNVYNDEGVHTARGEFQYYIIEDSKK